MIADITVMNPPAEALNDWGSALLPRRQTGAAALPAPSVMAGVDDTVPRPAVTVNETGIPLTPFPNWSLT